jgi:acetoin utilization protein AcuA
MPSYPQRQRVVGTPHGAVRIRSFCPPEEIRRCAFTPQFGTHAQYRSLYTRRESLEANAQRPDTNVTLALNEKNEIVGFGVLTHPDDDERWARLPNRVMTEVKVIEVARDCRSAGLARGILDLLMQSPFIEEKIAYMVGYSWTWDLDGTRKTAQEYRRMLIGLFEPFGFVELQTNEPNICLKPENLFMGRVGRRLTEAVRTDFKWLRFGINPA